MSVKSGDATELGCGKMPTDPRGVNSLESTYMITTWQYGKYLLKVGRLVAWMLKIGKSGKLDRHKGTVITFTVSK